MLALAAPQDGFEPGRMTGVAFESPDPQAIHAELNKDVDLEFWGGDGTVHLGFFFRDNNTNQLMVVEAPQAS